MSESSSSAEVDFLDLCENNVRGLEYILASGENLLNQRQCKDLSSKLSKTTQNVRELVLYCETSVVLFRPALENLYRCLEKAKALVSSCAEEDWCAAAVFQIQSESAFQEILSDVSLCYNTIYELAKSTSKDWNGPPEDLRQSSVFERPATIDGVHKDQLDLEKRLNDSAKVEFLNLCRKNVLGIKNLVNSGNVLLNQRQCLDLSTKLSIIALNIFKLVSHNGTSVVHFHLALKNLYRYLEKAKALVSSCAEEDWLAAAVFQIQNESAYRDILLDVSFCYNTIYELAKSTSKDWNDPPEDLRQPPMSVFKPILDSGIDDDKQDLQKRLDDLANGYAKFKPVDYLVPGRIARRQSLAKYLLVKMCYTPSEPQSITLDTYSAILWRKVSEPGRTWGNSRLIGAGSGASGVVSTTWLGIPCAKKEFHGQEIESVFLREAGILAHLKHPCIVNFICCGNGLAKGDRFIAMEKMDMSLFDLIEEQKGAHFSLSVAVDMMVQIARGVCYLHGRGVAHRDLKPQNVVVNRLTSPHLSEDQYCVKLVDFGMSKTKVEVSKLNTMSAVGIGTTLYRAPEIFRQAHPDGKGKATWFKADVYSFGMTCAHLMSLKTPFGEMQNLSELYNKLMKGERPELPVDCPQELVALLKDCWKTKPGSRPTFMEVCIRLEKFRHVFLMGFAGGNEGLQEEKMECNGGFNFIKMKVEEQSSIQTLLVDNIDDSEQVFSYYKNCNCNPMHKYTSIFRKQVKRLQLDLPSLPCTSGHALELGAFYKFKTETMSKLGSNLKSCSSAEVDYFDLCTHNVRNIEDLVSGGTLLNQIQSKDLSIKLSKTTLNIRELVDKCGGSAKLFRPALEDLYRCLEKAKVLVSKCGEKDWCAAAVFQIHNKDAFRGILMEVGLCYNAIYEQAKSMSEDSNVDVEDLRQTLVFQPATDDDILLDQQGLQKRLEDSTKEPRSFKLLSRLLSDKGALKQCLAKYLLVKLNYASEQSQATSLDACSKILWHKESELPGTWGKYSHFLGSGTVGGVCKTKWMGLPCAKKEFHVKEYEDLFLKEAGIMAHLKHPCIIDFFCCGNGQERGDRFIAMELMEKSLFKLIEDQKSVHFPLPVVIDMMVQIARGMRYLHDQGVAHRDLKPQNVVANRLTSTHLGGYFCVKLVDFGMSKTKVEVSKSNFMTALGIGTTQYKAPEVSKQAHPDGKGKATWFKADVFSFAMTCAHLLSLETPFGEMQNSSELYKKLMNGERPRLPIDCPQELVALLNDCWRTKPGLRPSFVEVCTRLENFRHTFLRGYGGGSKSLEHENMVSVYQDKGGGAVFDSNTSCR